VSLLALPLERPPARARRGWPPALSLGGVLTLLLVLTALLSFLWLPGSATTIDVAHKLAPPSPEHWLGTDHFGRDVAAMIMVGARNAILVGLVAVGLGILLGVSLGLLAAAAGGWIEEGLLRAADFTYAFPALLSAILATTLLGPGAVNAMLAIGLVNVPIFLRLTRAAARSIWVTPFVLAARALGKGPARITIDHILPNVAGLLIVQATSQFALAVLAEAGLSYLGLGTQPPHPSWGRMLYEAQSFLFLAPRLAVYPGLAIFLAVLGLSLFGDGLRDRLDPRLRR
jgi:peptide/nickel transport system permease protein